MADVNEMRAEPDPHLRLDAGPDPSVDRTIRSLRSRGLAVRRWPAPPGEVTGPLVHQPTIWIVGPGIDPPAREDLTDWIREPLDPIELRGRADGLIARASESGPIYLELQDGVLHVDGAIVILSITEAALLQPLVERLGQIISREDLVREVWPDQDAPLRLLNRHVASLRRRFVGLPLALHAVRGRGILLERSPIGT